MANAKNKHLLVADNFFPGSNTMRAYFDGVHRDPRIASGKRFIWDFWHVPDQYTLLRTPAVSFFPKKPFNDFLKHLTKWGRENLGCESISPPWLSNYVEGCQQQLHADVPHGPWAYVFSLCPKKSKFSGGQTLFLRPEVLQYWHTFSDSKGRELSSIVQRVEPKFNRLVVFDPRIPHGVTRVGGTLDPREGRLVIHGWFTEPRPFFQGTLSPKQVAPIVDGAVENFFEMLAGEGSWHGSMSLRLDVEASGSVTKPKILVDTVVPVDGDPLRSSAIRANLVRSFSSLRFPRARGKTLITLPLLFR